jgi:hypothetical protein
METSATTRWPFVAGGGNKAKNMKQGGGRLRWSLGERGARVRRASADVSKIGASAVPPGGVVWVVVERAERPISCSVWSRRSTGAPE